MDKEKIEEELAEIKELERARSDYIDMAAHQLRTPLSGIKWVFENLSKDASLSPETLSTVRDSLDETNRALGIVNDMLKIREAELSVLAITKKPSSFLTLLNEIKAKLAHLIEQRQTALSIDGEDCMVQVDLAKIEAAFLNIIDNAVRYSPGGTVSITVRLEGEAVVVKVADSGIGIAREDLPKLFSRFHRGDNAKALDPGESGIGLYLSKQIIEKHGGILEVESEIGKGTTVTVKLPMK